MSEHCASSIRTTSPLTRIGASSAVTFISVPIRRMNKREQESDRCIMRNLSKMVWVTITDWVIITLVLVAMGAFAVMMVM